MAGFDYSRSNTRWQRLRQRALKRDGYRCRQAARFGRAEDATHVHHIWPAEDYPEYAYCLWNCLSLSLSAHDAIHIMDWKKKLTSRKFWMAVVAFITPLLLAFGVAETEVTQVTAIIMAGADVLAYIIAEGMVDAKNAAA